MTAWHEPPEVFQPVRDAYLAWQRTQPQLFLELPDASPPPGEGSAVPTHIPADPQRPAAPTPTPERT